MMSICTAFFFWTTREPVDDTAQLIISASYYSRPHASRTPKIKPCIYRLCTCISSPSTRRSFSSPVLLINLLRTLLSARRKIVKRNGAYAHSLDVDF
ncbi:hypothetical protein BDA96_01G509200 [Sorghum bicolor]|uniref:Uncharacterized protein n=2 Tax=Sorghum bicolor TaxID=4558 RepID=A0A921V1F4_SORBI|nr:hypothetical protein BDA96_01G509200 [Sorghum bicolor]OQU93098.1 hypothetical protein SORBI_3001G477650 [Sorghum bicolor]